MASLNVRVAALVCVLIGALAVGLGIYAHRSISTSEQRSHAAQIGPEAEAALAQLPLPIGTDNCLGDQPGSPTINRCWTTLEPVRPATQNVEAALLGDGVTLSGSCTVEGGQPVCYYQGLFHGTELHAVIRPNISEGGAQEAGAQIALTLFLIPGPGSATPAA